MANEQEQYIGAFKLPAALVFRPSPTEFERPLDYIASIRSIAEPYGICSITPPRGWKFPLAINKDSFKFDTTVQKIHKLQKSSIDESGETDYVIPDVTRDDFSIETGTKGIPISNEQLPKKRKIENHEQHAAGSISSIACTKCHGLKHGSRLLLCDKCDTGYHIFCLSPPLENVPKGSWLCPSCTPTYEYVFSFGEEVTFPQFRSMAKQFEKEFWDPALKIVPMEQIEAEFWNIVEDGEKIVNVRYGTEIRDITAFPPGLDPTKASTDFEGQRFATSGWNFHNINNRSSGGSGKRTSLLAYAGEDISGVNKSWLYVGMTFSSFCWHVEDSLFYSVNYHHFGKPKQWYGVPYEAAPAFEALFGMVMPDQLRARPDMLFHLDAMVSPRLLKEHNVPVYSLVQEEGQFVVTFPGAYHAGFSYGVNCGEAVNLVPADWLRYSAVALERCRNFRKPPVLCIVQLLLSAARDNPPVHDAVFLYHELTRIIAEERRLRLALWIKGVRECRDMRELWSTQWPGCNPSGPVNPKSKVPGDTTGQYVLECVICHAPLYLSAVDCSCQPVGAAVSASKELKVSGRAVCLHHAALLCECEAKKQRLWYQESLGELQELAEQLGRKCGYISEVHPRCGAASCMGQSNASCTRDDSSKDLHNATVDSHLDPMVAPQESSKEAAGVGDSAGNEGATKKERSKMDAALMGGSTWKEAADTGCGSNTEAAAVQQEYEQALKPTKMKGRYEAEEEELQKLEEGFQRKMSAANRQIKILDQNKLEELLASYRHAEIFVTKSKTLDEVQALRKAIDLMLESMRKKSLEQAAQRAHSLTPSKSSSVEPSSANPSVKTPTGPVLERPVPSNPLRLSRPLKLAKNTESCSTKPPPVSPSLHAPTGAQVPSGSIPTEGTKPSLSHDAIDPISAKVGTAPYHPSHHIRSKVPVTDSHHKPALSPSTLDDARNSHVHSPLAAPPHPPSILRATPPKRSESPNAAQVPVQQTSSQQPLPTPQSKPNPSIPIAKDFPRATPAHYFPAGARVASAPKASSNPTRTVHDPSLEKRSIAALAEMATRLDSDRKSLKSATIAGSSGPRPPTSSTEPRQPVDSSAEKRGTLPTDQPHWLQNHHRSSSHAHRKFSNYVPLANIESLLYISRSSEVAEVPHSSPPKTYDSPAIQKGDLQWADKKRRSASRRHPVSPVRFTPASSHLAMPSHFAKRRRSESDDVRSDSDKVSHKHHRPRYSSYVREQDPTLSPHNNHRDPPLTRRSSSLMQKRSSKVESAPSSRGCSPDSNHRLSSRLVELETKVRHSDKKRPRPGAGFYSLQTDSERSDSEGRAVDPARDNIDGPKMQQECAMGTKSQSSDQEPIELTRIRDTCAQSGKAGKVQSEGSLPQQLLHSEELTVPIETYLHRASPTGSRGFNHSKVPASQTAARSGGDADVTETKPADPALQGSGLGGQKESRCRHYLSLAENVIPNSTSADETKLAAEVRPEAEKVLPTAAESKAFIKEVEVCESTRVTYERLASLLSKPVIVELQELEVLRERKQQADIWLKFHQLLATRKYVSCQKMEELVSMGAGIPLKMEEVEDATRRLAQAKAVAAEAEEVLAVSQSLIQERRAAESQPLPMLGAASTGGVRSPGMVDVSDVGPLQTQEGLETSGMLALPSSETQDVLTAGPLSITDVVEGSRELLSPTQASMEASPGGPLPTERTVAARGEGALPTQGLEGTSKRGLLPSHGIAEPCVRQALPTQNAAEVREGGTLPTFNQEGEFPAGVMVGCTQRSLESSQGQVDSVAGRTLTPPRSTNAKDGQPLLVRFMLGATGERVYLALETLNGDLEPASTVLPAVDAEVKGSGNATNAQVLTTLHSVDRSQIRSEPLASASLALAKTLQDALATLRTLDGSAEVTLPSSEPVETEERALPSLEELKSLRKRLKATRVIMPVSERLKAAISMAEEAQASAKRVLISKWLGQLEQWQQQYMSLACELPDKRTIDSLVLQAHNWREQAAEALAGEGPLDAARKLLEAGQAIGVKMEETECLRVSIRQREWEGRARQCLEGYTPAPELKSVLADAAACSSAASASATALQDRLTRLVEWDTQRAAVLRRLKRVNQQARDVMKDSIDLQLPVNFEPLAALVSGIGLAAEEFAKIGLGLSVEKAIPNASLH